MFSPHVGVEASVGFYQAVDRGFEELSATDNLPATNPASRSAQPRKPENRYSAGHETSSRKAAAVVTASTLAGALLWIAGRKRADDEQDAQSHDEQRLAL
jgi:hypothetical protein